MAAPNPNMAAITASLEKSLQNCSLNHQESSAGGATGLGHTATSTSPENHHLDATFELNSQISLPFHWEQCLDLKTGEIYYINWRTGMKVTEDPRTTVEYSGDLYSEDDFSSYDSEESSSEPSTSSLWNDNRDHQSNEQENLNVLVVAGCKRCLMYHMVPKQLQDCPKCFGQLIYLNGST